MMTVPAIRVNLLVSLRSASGAPVPESVLVEGIVAVSPATPRDTVRAQIRELERLRMVSAVRDEVLDQDVWVLTTAGEAKANQLR